MKPRMSARFGLILISAFGLLAVSACQNQQPEPVASPTILGPSQSTFPELTQAPLKNEVPAGELGAVMAAHFKGLGHMERYEYRNAAEAFREVHRRAPGWIPGAINLAIALLNDSGVKAEAAKKAGADPAASNFDEALDLLAGILDRDPNNPHAHYCRGIILEQQGRLSEAHQHFKRVTEHDPNDAAAWYWMGATLTDPKNPVMSNPRVLAKEQIKIWNQALACDPYLTPAMYRVQHAYRLSNNREKADQLMAQWKQLNEDRDGPSPGTGDLVAKVYGEMGKYARVVNPFPRPEPTIEAAAVPLNFEPAKPINVKLAQGERWVKPSDFSGALAVLGRARARFGAAIAAFDADGDGQLDLFLASAVVGSKGVRDALLLNKGDGRFEDASAAFGLPKDHPSLGVAAADFDADRHIDLLLTGVGDNRLLHNRGGKTYEDISSTLKSAGPKALSLMARWLDLDQDGDLDLYIVNYCAVEHADEAFTGSGKPLPGLANSVYRNDGQPDLSSGATAQGRTPVATAYGDALTKTGLSLALVPWTEMPPLLGGDRAHTGIALLDLDNDRDLDLVLAADNTSPVAVLNDRIGRFHEVAIERMTFPEPVSGLVAIDFDTDGRTDLVAPCPTGRVLAWLNTTELTRAEKTQITFESWPINVTGWRTAQAVDLNLDGRPDLLGLPAASGKPGDLVLPEWARNEGKRYSAKTLSLGPEIPDQEGLTAVDLVGDALADIVVIRPGEPPALAKNLGNGQHWLALQLGGHWRVKPELMRTNSHAIGTRVLVEGQGIHATYDHTTPESGLGQSIAPFVLGLGRQEKAELVHLRWPDGVMQCELNVAGNQKINLAENNRKTGSCPVLFTWNGRRFVCIGDFLGGGGLGYLIAPGVYSQPDRDEAVAITADQLEPSDGVIRLSVTEPMDEVAYLDHLRLDVVDHPPGVSSTPDERFAPDGPRPTGELLAWRTTVEPIRATDLEGRDVTETLRHRDRRTVDAFRRRQGWIGYAEDHAIILDFGDRLSCYGPSDPLVLCLAGWVEYPYSQTNYAAATAGVALQPPAIERRRDDGRWEVIEPHAGYPAGMPRLMTLDLTGKLAGPRCVLRIKTNMECYYDQAFIAVRDRAAAAALRVKTLPVARAVLGYRGYTREVSPDGRQPLIYDYDYVDPAPLARFAGKLTRYGDVAPLLQADDDQLCLVGPGDEVRIEFEASGLPPLPEGWTRSYVLRSFGYCKDADPFTATSDTVLPLPWREMPAFPFAPQVKRPGDRAYESYLRVYQTRPAGGGG
ncbi:MAG: FG-GAP-like repeat-containing protein [Isosphaerales bacterium]